MAFLLLLIAILAIPVTFTFDVSWRDAVRNDSRLEWAFGLVRVKIPSSEPKAIAPEQKETEKKSGGSRRSSREKWNVAAAVRLRGFRRRIIRFVRDAWQAVRKNDLRMRVRIGLGDPADTGQLWAVVGPVAAVMANAREASITVEPDFFNSTFELDGSGSVRFIPLQMVYLTGALLLSPPFWQGIRQMRRAG